MSGQESFDSWSGEAPPRIMLAVISPGKVMDIDEATKLLRSGEVGVSAWNKHRDENAEIPDLARANLTYTRLIGANLTGVNLAEADLDGAKLFEARLIGADLTKAKLFWADLYCAEIDGARLEGAKFNGADLTGASLNGAKLSGVSLNRAQLSGAKFIGADLHEADLHEADLSMSDLTGADLRKAQLTSTNLDGAILKDRRFNNVPISPWLFGESAGLSAVNTEVIESAVLKGPISTGRGADIPSFRTRTSRRHWASIGSSTTSPAPSALIPFPDPGGESPRYSSRAAGWHRGRSSRRGSTILLSIRRNWRTSYIEFSMHGRRGKT